MQQIEQYLRKLKIKGRSQSTLVYYRYTLMRFRQFYTGPWGDICEDDIDEYICHEQDREIQSSTINCYLRVVRAFLNWQQADIKIKSIKEYENEIYALSRQQIKSIYDACLSTGGNAFIRYRDYLVMRTMELTGMRIGEVCRLRVDDVNIKYLTIGVKQTKNKRNRTVYFPPGFVKEIKKYLEVRQHFLCEKGLAATNLFVTQRGEAISSKCLLQNISNYGNMAGISDVRVSPHTFRHTFAHNFLMLGGGADIYTLKDILGHSTLAMVYRYARLWDVERQTKYQAIMRRYK